MISLTAQEAFAYTLIAVDWCIRIAAIFVVPRNRRPTAAISWLMLIFILPIPGLLFFLLIGNPKLPKHRREAQKHLDAAITKTLRSIKRSRANNSLLDVAPPEKYQHQAALNLALAHLPVTGGNHLEVLDEYDKVFARIIADIDRAEQFVHVEYFIACLDNETAPFFDALTRAAKRGVTVRFLYDSYSTKRYPGYKALMERLQGDGIHAMAMLPLRLPGKGYVRPDLRNHRKIVVVDGYIGYTGSQNMIARNYHRKDDLYYDEVVARVEGPAALQLAAVVMTDWHAETGTLFDTKLLQRETYELKAYGTTSVQILPSGPGYDDQNNLKFFTSLFYSAKSSITIVNPYFVPDEALSTAIVSAARRGVSVTMINSEAMDQWMVGHAQRSFYEELLEAGVKLYLYQAPTLLHSKFIIVDNDLAAIGSSNLDIRSFLLNLEITLVAYDKSVVRQLRHVEKTYLARSTQIHLHEWRKRPPRKLLLDNIARLTSSLQ